jgi:hypothetical protein
MIEFQDNSGRLIVMLPMQFRYSGKSYAVFLEGRLVAEYQSIREAMDHARSLAKSEDSDQQPSTHYGDGEA